MTDLTRIDDWLNDDLQACMAKVTAAIGEWIAAAPSGFITSESRRVLDETIITKHARFTEAQATYDLIDTVTDLASGYIAACYAEYRDEVEYEPTSWEPANPNRQSASDVMFQALKPPTKEELEKVLRPVPCNPATRRVVNTGMSCQVIGGDDE